MKGEKLKKTFEGARKEFDDIFYVIDKQTLAEVNQAHERVKAFEKLLKSLRQGNQ